MRLPPWLYNLIYRLKNINLRDKKTLTIIISVISAIIVATLAIILIVGAVNKAEDEGYWITSISVSKNPDNTTYKVGEQISYEGLWLQVMQSNGDYYIEQDLSEMTFIGFDSSAPAKDQPITVHYKGHVCTFTVNIEEQAKPIASLTRIYLDYLPDKLTYSISGDSGIDMTGAVLVREFSDGNTQITDVVPRDVVEKWAQIKELGLGKHDLTISYTYRGVTKTTTFTITLTE